MTSLRDSWQQQKRQRQQATIDRRQQVKLLLADLQRSRQKQAAQQQTGLQTFHQQLQQQTASDIATIAAARAVLAQQLATELQCDRQRFSQAVVLLRQALQQRVRSLQLETHAWFNDCHQQRQQVRQQQIQELTREIACLQQQVQTLLAELAVLQPARAASVQQMLTHTRTQRQSEVASLFEQLAVFRAELRQHRAALAQQVWGEVATIAAVLPTTEPIESVELPAAAASIELAAEPVESVTAAQPVALAPAEDPWIEADQPTRTLLKSEERIYGYLREQQGARLTEIETLGLTRFQIVDALRSLIQKGLVQQRDRVYQVQA